MYKVNLIGKENLQFGYGKDLAILKEELLLLDCEVTESCVKDKPLYFLKTKKPLFDINIFIDEPTPFWFRAAKKNWLLPNQDCFLLEWRAFLKEIDLVLCKTHYAEKIFKSLGSNTAYVGFRGYDRRVSGITKEKHFLHCVGKSPFKNTDVVIETWLNNKALPHLTVIENPVAIRRVPEVSNLTYIAKHVDNQLLLEIQNRSLFHLCPSIAEGFGHYIMEALSAEALVLTTDGPPMNELITNEHGVLIPWKKEQPMRVGSSFYVSSDALAKAVRDTLNLSDQEIGTRRKNGRLFFEQKAVSFRQDFRLLLNSEPEPACVPEPEKK